MPSQRLDGDAITNLLRPWPDEGCDVALELRDFVLETAPELAETIAFNASGIGTAALTDVDGTSTWISADEGHTLRRLLALTFDGTGQATTAFTGSSQLLAGDFSDDNFVDIVDFSILAANFSTLGDEADATCDGVQGSADFTTILANFFVPGDEVDGCTLLGGYRFATSGPVASISPAGH